MTDLALTQGGGYTVTHLEDDEEVRELLRGARAESTRAVYGRAFRAFAIWCAGQGLKPMPASPPLVKRYIAHLVRRSLAPSTIAMHVAAIAHAHRHAGHGFDTSLVEGALDGARRKNKRKPKKAKAATLDVLEKLPNGSDLRSLRDRAIILLGFWGARRRSELAGLDVSDALTEGATGHIEFVPEGIVIRLAVSKTNQTGETEDYAIPYGSEPCAIEAVRTWINATGIENGALFRKVDKWGKPTKARLSGHSINEIVKKQLGKDFTGHALRRGFLTEGARNGLTGLELAQQSGHASQDMVRQYVKEADLFAANPARKLTAARNQSTKARKGCAR